MGDAMADDPNAYFTAPFNSVHNLIWYSMLEGSYFPEYEKETPKSVVMKGAFKTLVFGATVVVGIASSYYIVKDDPASEVKHDLAPEDINFASIYSRTVEEGAQIVCQCSEYAVDTSKVVDPKLPKDKYFRLHAVCQQGDHDQTLSFSTAEQFATSYAGGSLSRETFVSKEPFGCDEWKTNDFLSEGEFCQSIQWDTRHISFGELCKSADKFIGNQISAYLETQLFSLELLTPEEIEEQLRERFKQAKNLAVSTFQLAYDLDTFRLDFEGVQTAWASDLNFYLDRLHKNDILARLNAYEEHYDATLLVAFRDHVGDSPVPGEWWEESIATLWGMEVISDDFWFPYEVQTPLANVPFSWHTPINNDKCWDVDMDVTAAYCCFCAAQCQSDWVADGWCDPECNNPGCGYDGGDCCGDTCVSSFSDCGDNGYNCMDPGVVGFPSTEAPTTVPTIVVGGTIVLAGITEAEFTGDAGLQEALKNDIEDAAGVTAAAVELIFMNSDADSSSSENTSSGPASSSSSGSSPAASSSDASPASSSSASSPAASSSSGSSPAGSSSDASPASSSSASSPAASPARRNMSRRSLLQSVQVEFRITVLSADFDVTVIANIEGNFDVDGTTAYATANNYGDVTATVAGVTIIGDPVPTTSPTLGSTPAISSSGPASSTSASSPASSDSAQSGPSSSSPASSSSASSPASSNSASSPASDSSASSPASSSASSPTSSSSASSPASSSSASSPASSSSASSPASSPARRNVRRSLLNLENAAGGVDTKPQIHPTLRNLPTKLTSQSDTYEIPSKDRVQRSLATGECSADNGDGSDDGFIDDVVHGWESGLTPQWQVEGFETCWDANLARHGDVGYDSYNECCSTTRIAAREATPWPRSTVPTGNQLAEFSSAVFALQLYCTEQGFPMGHLYETKPSPAQSSGGDIITALSEHHIKAWVKRIFEEWTWGNLDLRVPDTYTDDDGELAYAEYGQGKASCLRVPSLVNYVPADCDCQKTPSCETNSMHKFEFYVGRKQVTSTFDLETPMTLACSYFRQIDIFRNEQIIFRPDEMAGRSHHFNCSLDQSSISNLNSETSVLSPSMDEYFATVADFKDELDTFDLRKEMKKALVQDWSDGVLSAPEIGAIEIGNPEAGALDWQNANFTYRLYYDQCAPDQCYEVVLENNSLMTFFLAALAGFVQIGTFLATFIGSAAYQGFKLIWPKQKKKYVVSKTEKEDPEMSRQDSGSGNKVHAIA